MIWLDSREKRSDSASSRRRHDDLAELLSLFHAVGLRTQRKQLTFGDMAFEGHGPRGPAGIGIERKTVSDFISSLLSGRLTSHQIPGMRKLYDYCYLIIQGITRRNMDSGLLETFSYGKWHPLTLGPRTVPHSMLDSARWSMEIQGGLIVRMTSSDRNTVEEIAGIYRGWQKPWDAHSSFKSLHLPSSPTVVIHPPSIARQAAALLPGIGWERSGAVAARFRTMEDITGATISEWAEIDGIGKATAEKAYWAIRGGKRD
ncbi:MAG TPA: ERCC4 domain-containing protein [Anaerolineales bacterium]